MNSLLKSYHLHACSPVPMRSKLTCTWCVGVTEHNGSTGNKTKNNKWTNTEFMVRWTKTLYDMAKGIIMYTHACCYRILGWITHSHTYSEIIYHNPSGSTRSHPQAPRRSHIYEVLLVRRRAAQLIPPKRAACRSGDAVGLHPIGIQWLLPLQAVTTEPELPVYHSKWA